MENSNLKNVRGGKNRSFLFAFLFAFLVIFVSAFGEFEVVYAFIAIDILLWINFAEFIGFEKVANLIINKNVYSIDEIAKRLGKTRDKTEKTIHSMIKRRLLEGFAIKDGMIMPENMAKEELQNEIKDLEDKLFAKPKDKEPTLVKCKNCGAVGKVTGKQGTCEYCGSILDVPKE